MDEMVWTADRDTGDVLFRRCGSAAVIRLNRPKALNSLNLAMVRAIRAALESHAADDTISCVIMTGAGERGLCAGGDIRVIHDMGKAGDPHVTQFWREEFPLNHFIAHYPKPYVALMDGIVMGGGIGISAHGRYRLVTERTRLAMPETGIGYFPDIGATWLLPSAPGELGTWLGLTGETVGAADAIAAGLADRAVSSEALGDLVAALGELPPGAQDGQLQAVIGRFAIAPADGVLQPHRNLIDSTFCFDRVEEVVAALEAASGAFAEATLAAIGKRSPTSLKLTLALLRQGRASASLAECLEREFAAACAVLHQPDFYEGVRAAIIDKDRNPRWQPGRLADVTEAALAPYFQTGEKALFVRHRM